MPEVIVVGGGIAGSSTAWYLAAAGVDVLLLEAGELNAAASGANAGSLHAQIQHEPFVRAGEAWVRGFLPALPFYRYAIDVWEEAATQFGDVLEFARTGGLIVAATAAQMRDIEAKTRFEQAAGFGTELLDRTALRQLAPYVSETMIGGAFCPIEGKANPLRAAPAFAEAAVARGASLRPACRVLAIERTRDGYAVATTDGVFEAPRVVNAAGIHVGRIAALVGCSLPVRGYPIQLSVTEPLAPLVDHLVYSAESMLTLKQTAAGTVIIGGGWPASLDAQGRAQVRPESLSRNLSVAARAVPQLGEALLYRSWAAVVNGTDSWLPILGEAGALPGFFVNYVPWMGFTGGPAGGRIVASQILGGAAPVDFDLEAFRPDRQ